MSAGRIWAIVIVALIHALIGYAFVTGLATKALKQVREDLKTFDVEEPPPPEEEPPPPPPDQPTNPPPVTVPPVAQRMQTQNPMQAPVSPPVPYVPITPTAPTAPPAPVGPPPAPPLPPPPPPPPPPPRQAAKAAVQRSGTISNDDYPASAIRAGASGNTTIRMTISADGRVSGCTVSGSSGNSALDSTACSLAQRRFRFTPAEDTSGNAVAGSATRTVRWQLPDE